MQLIHRNEICRMLPELLSNGRKATF